MTALLDALPELYFYAKDRDSRFVMANAAEIELLGLSSLEQMLGKATATSSNRPSPRFTSRKTGK